MGDGGGLVLCLPACSEKHKSPAAYLLGLPCDPRGQSGLTATARVLTPPVLQVSNGLGQWGVWLLAFHRLTTGLQYERSKWPRYCSFHRCHTRGSGAIGKRAPICLLQSHGKHKKADTQNEGKRDAAMCTCVCLPTPPPLGISPSCCSSHFFFLQRMQKQLEWEKNVLYLSHAFLLIYAVHHSLGFSIGSFWRFWGRVVGEIHSSADGSVIRRQVRRIVLRVEGNGFIKQEVSFQLPFTPKIKFFFGLTSLNYSFV